MQNEFIKMIGRRPVYPARKDWNEFSGSPRPEAGRRERERRKDEVPRDEAVRQASRADRD